MELKYEKGFKPLLLPKILVLYYRLGWLALHLERLRKEELIEDAGGELQDAAEIMISNNIEEKLNC